MSMSTPFKFAEAVGRIPTSAYKAFFTPSKSKAAASVDAGEEDKFDTNLHLMDDELEGASEESESTRIFHRNLGAALLLIFFFSMASPLLLFKPFSVLSSRPTPLPSSLLLPMCAIEASRISQLQDKLSDLEQKAANKRREKLELLEHEIGQLGGKVEMIDACQNTQINECEQKLNSYFDEQNQWTEDENLRLKQWQERIIERDEKNRALSIKENEETRKILDDLGLTFVSIQKMGTDQTAALKQAEKIIQELKLALMAGEERHKEALAKQQELVTANKALVMQRAQVAPDNHQEMVGDGSEASSRHVEETAALEVQQREKEISATTQRLLERAKLLEEQLPNVIKGADAAQQALIAAETKIVDIQARYTETRTRYTESLELLQEMKNRSERLESCTKQAEALVADVVIDQCRGVLEEMHNEKESVEKSLAEAEAANTICKRILATSPSSSNSRADFALLTAGAKVVLGETSSTFVPPLKWQNKLLLGGGGNEDEEDGSKKVLEAAAKFGQLISDAANYFGIEKLTKVG